MGAEGRPEALLGREADPSAETVLIEPGRLGDVSFAGPLVRALARRHPRGSTTVVARPGPAAVAERMVGVDRVVIFDKRGADRGLSGLRRLGQRIGRADLVYSAHPSVRTALLAAQIAGSSRVGSVNADPLARWTYHAVRGVQRSGPVKVPFVAERLQLLGPPCSDLGMAGTLRRSRPSEMRMGLVVGAAWATKRFPPDRLAEIVRGGLSLGLSVTLLGAPDERALAEAVVQALPRTARTGVERRFPPSVRGLIDEIERCTVVVGGDTGPVHIGRGLGLAAVVLFGPTPEEAHVPGPWDRFVTAPDVPCRPCHRHGPRRCPKGHHRCVWRVSPKTVVGALEELIRGFSREGQQQTLQAGLPAGGASRP